ncbi:MAG: serine/threonine-protein kinase, partial [Gemmatimonadota bacterium]|jgi:tetratricopeptide (TPR) repeat protein
VALKFLRPDLSASLGFERFRREIGIAANLNHPHIVPLYDSGESEGRLYYVMPLVEGITLQAALREESPFDTERALEIVSDVAEALAYAHRRGLVHRDIKPSNIILTSDHAVVTDFGVATVLDDAGPTITTAGSMIGTPGYMAPEQATGEEDVDQRADVYSLGCLAYEMLAGQPPFKSRTVQARLAHQLSVGASPLSATNPDLPLSLTEAVRRAMATDPSDRFATVTDFVDALQAGGSWSPVTLLPRRLRPRSRAQARGLSAALGVAVIGASLAAMYLSMDGGPGAESWPGGRPPSVVVLPMETTTTTDEERDVAVAVAGDVTSELAYWDGIRAVPGVSLTGPMFDLGIAGPAVARLEDGVRLARRLGVAALVSVTADVRGDSTRIQAALFDVAGGESDSRVPFGPMVEAVQATANTLALAEPIARRVLGLENEPFVSLEAERRRSRLPEALAEEDEGTQYLERWRLTEAEAAFRRAIALDSTFGFAQHRLAQTLYWQYSENPTARDPATLLEIARHSSAALRLADDLPASDRAHVVAFHAFQEGDYAEARQDYRDILEADSTDVYAWLLLGSVEFRDPWLTSAAPAATPRGNWNLAVRAFTRAVELQPTFELGYGHIFDIYEAAAGTLGGSTSHCQGFMTPNGVSIPPWERRTPENQRPFCLATPDSLAWLPRAELASADLDAMRPTAEALRDQGTRLLTRWSLYAPELPRPLEELATATLNELSRLSVAPPEQIESLAASALEYRLRALALTSDTLPIDLFQVSNLYLATGRTRDAVSVAEEGIRLRETAFAAMPLPAEAVNPFLATGQVSRAVSLLPDPITQRFEPDTLTGRIVPWGRALAPFRRATLLGSAMVGGPPLRAELEQIARVWSAPSYTDRDRSLLRNRVSPSLAIAFAFDDDALRAWGDVPDLDDPLWRSLVAVAGGEDAASELLDSALAADTPRVTETSESLVEGALALRIGRADTALRLLSRLDSIPFRVDQLETRWGILSSSFLLRGDAYLALGDTSSAVAAYERYVGRSSEGDPLTEPMLRRAREVIAVAGR